MGRVPRTPGVRGRACVPHAGAGFFWPRWKSNLLTYYSWSIAFSFLFVEARAQRPATRGFETALHTQRERGPCSSLSATLIFLKVGEWGPLHRWPPMTWPAAARAPPKPPSRTRASLLVIRGPAPLSPGTPHALIVLTRSSAYSGGALSGVGASELVGRNVLPGRALAEMNVRSRIALDKCPSDIDQDGSRPTKPRWPRPRGSEHGSE